MLAAAAAEARGVAQAERAPIATLRTCPAPEIDYRKHQISWLYAEAALRDRGYAPEILAIVKLSPDEARRIARGVAGLPGVARQEAVNYLLEVDRGLRSQLEPYGGRRE